MGSGYGHRARGGAFHPCTKLARGEFDRDALPKILATFGTLDVRLATSEREVRLGQKLRYQVFFEEGGAIANPIARLRRRDVCRFDRLCEHLIAVDNSAPRFDRAPTVVGAYRLLRQDVAEANFGFYSAREFAVETLIARHPGKRFLELGRSCVAQGYRGKRTLELLWRGIWAYALWRRIDAMFGCASFPGVDPNAHAATLRFLRGEGAIDPDWSVDAVGGGATESAADETAPLDPRASLRALPPLIKGYWRLGAKFSRQAVVDQRFGTTDVLAVLPIDKIQSRYLAHFGPREDAAPMAA